MTNVRTISSDVTGHNYFLISYNPGDSSKIDNWQVKQHLLGVMAHRLNDRLFGLSDRSVNQKVNEFSNVTIFVDQTPLGEIKMYLYGSGVAPDSVVKLVGILIDDMLQPMESAKDVTELIESLKDKSPYDKLRNVKSIGDEMRTQMLGFIFGKDLSEPMEDDYDDVSIKSLRNYVHQVLDYRNATVLYCGEQQTESTREELMSLIKSAMPNNNSEVLVDIAKYQLVFGEPRMHIMDGPLWMALVGSPMMQAMYVMKQQIGLKQLVMAVLLQTVSTNIFSDISVNVGVHGGHLIVELRTESNNGLSYLVRKLVAAKTHFEEHTIVEILHYVDSLNKGGLDVRQNINQLCHNSYYLLSSCCGADVMGGLSFNDTSIVTTLKALTLDDVRGFIRSLKPLAYGYIGPVAGENDERREMVKNEARELLGVNRRNIAYGKREKRTINDI